MPAAAKLLFRPSVLGPRLAAFQVPERAAAARERLSSWVELLASPRAERLTEAELLPDFLTDVFYELLGYAGPSGGVGRHSLSRERRVEVDGKYADAVLGRLGEAPEQVFVAVEGKRPADPLDRPFGGRRMSAVDQGYRYAINLPCDRIIVTNLREIRLYHKGHDQRTFERFELARLAESEAALRRFVYLLGAERVAPASGPPHLDALLAASDRADLELTRAYYAEYAAMRRDILDLLRTANPRVMPELLLFYTQKLLDRVLFVAFCEDRGLLPAETLKRAFEHTDPYNPRSRWETFKGLFRAIDQGNGDLGIPGYNGGLFQRDPGLDELEIPPAVFQHFRRLGEFDYRETAQAADDETPAPHLVDVEILGHIFEQSITDLEQLQTELAAGEFEPGGGVSRRRREGAFYTPDFITRFIVGRALSTVLEDRFRRLRDRHLERAKKGKGKAHLALADPRVYDLDALFPAGGAPGGCARGRGTGRSSRRRRAGETRPSPQRAALIRFWDAWIAELQTVRLVDPACGSGAFLIEAFDQFHAAYQEAAERLIELRSGEATLFDPDRTILRHNLYGVDLNEEAIQICRLSIWIKTAQAGKRLTDLDHNIRVGNSLVADPEVEPRVALDWRAAFPEAFADGGFDVVVGNPPYVRQELLGGLKPYLETNYVAYHGMADLYVYFFERGLKLLRPGGRLSFVVTNKWLKAGYAEPLRRLLAERSKVETVVDLGHAKQVFPEADVFPSIVVLEKPQDDRRPSGQARISVIPRDELRIEDLEHQVAAEGFDLPLDRLGAGSWFLEPAAVTELMTKLRDRHAALKEFAGVKPFYGVKTGCNDAFLIDQETRRGLVADDPRSDEVLKPYLRGQDVQRWRALPSSLWMIFARRGIDIAHYPAVLRHLERFRRELEPKPPGWTGGRWPGRKPGTYQWYEIQDSVDYWKLFEQPKLMYQDIAWTATFCFDAEGLYPNNTIYILPTSDRWLLTVLNSPVFWWVAWRGAQHAKDEALRMFRPFVESFPVPQPADGSQGLAEDRVERLERIQQARHEASTALLDWLAVEHGIDKPSRALLEPFALDCDALVAEVRRLRGRKNPLTAAALRSLREEHARTVVPAAERLAEAERLERELAELVNQAYGLTAEEVELMWRTAPPRMPPGGPAGRPNQTLKELLARMPDVGEDRDFERSPDQGESRDELSE